MRITSCSRNKPSFSSFFRASGRSFLILKGIVDVEAKATRKYLGFPFSFSILLAFYLICVLFIFDLVADKMAPKSALAELCRKVLKRPHKEDGSNSPRSTSSREPNFTATLGSSTLKI